MKIFKDASLKEELNKILDLGTVLAGDNKEYEFFILNDSEGELVDLNFSFNNDEVTVISFPSSLKSNETGKLVIKWSPSITIKKGLKTDLNIKGFEIYSP